MADYTWEPIKPLSDDDKVIDLAAIKPLYSSWRDSKKRLQESSPARLKEFNDRLIRRLSVETGILERLYDLDRGTTEALVTHGFKEDLVSRSDTDIEPSRLIDILRDQEAAIQLVMDCVALKPANDKECPPRIACHSNAPSGHYHRNRPIRQSTRNPFAQRKV